MKDFKKGLIGRRYGSASTSVWVRSNPSVVRAYKKRSDGSLGKLDLQNPKGIRAGVRVGNVYVGPSIKGKGLKLVEVVSGNVEDRKPYFG